MTLKRSTKTERTEMIKKGVLLRPKPVRNICQYFRDCIVSNASLRPKLVLFTAPSGMGTTEILDMVVCENPSTRNQSLGIFEVPIIKLDLPTKFSLDDFCIEIADELKLPNRNYIQFGSCEAFIKYWLKECKTRMLIIDDFTSIATMPKADKNTILRFVKKLGSALDITVVVAGTPRIWRDISGDEQLKFRAQKINFPAYSANDPSLIELLTLFSDWCPVKDKSTIADDRTFRVSLISKTQGLQVKIINELRKFAVFAIISQYERLTYDAWLEYHATED